MRPTDASAWLGQLDEYLEARLREHTGAVANGAAEPSPQPRKVLRVREPLGRDRRAITERPWEIEKFAMRGELTVIVAPPGAGKTTLTQQIMHAATSGGTDFGGFSISKPLKVCVFHWEDDEAEMDRKVQAIEERMGTNPHPENLKTVYCGAGDDEDDDDLILAPYDARTDKFTPTLGFDDVSAIVAAEQPDIVVIDPVANTFEGPEGNELLKRMGRLMRKLARRHNVAVILILHTKKYADEHGREHGRRPQRRNPRRPHPRRPHPVPDDQGRGRTAQHPARPAATASSASTTASRATARARKNPVVRDQRDHPAASTRSASISVGIFDPWEPTAAVPRHLQPDHPRHPARHRPGRDRSGRRADRRALPAPAKTPRTGPERSSLGTSRTAPRPGREPSSDAGRKRASSSRRPSGTKNTARSEPGFDPTPPNGRAPRHELAAPISAPFGCASF